MFAVVVGAEVPENYTVAKGRALLEKQVVPRVKGAPGFVAGYWMAPAPGPEGMSVSVFADEESARRAADMVKPTGEMRLLGVEVPEVVTSA